MYTLKERDNPYMRLLVEALKRAGVEVVGPKSGRFYLWQSIRAAGRPDIVHLQWQHGYFTGTTTLNALKRSAQFFVQLIGIRLVGIPVVWTIHNLVNHEGKQGRWELLMCRLLARNVSAMLVHCDAVIGRVAEVYRTDKSRIRVVPHGHYIGVYPEPPSRMKARRSLGLDANARVFLFFGQVRAYKGVGQLVDAFRAIDEPGARLVIAGEPKVKGLDELVDHIRSDARISTEFSFIPDDRLTEYMSACDLVVLPYRQSLTSGAAILAASCGRPIIAPHLGCMREFPQESAILFDPDVAGALEDALRQALKAPLDDMGAAARAYVAQFPWSMVAEKTSGVYRGASKIRS